MSCAASCAARCATPSLIGAREPLMWRLVPALVREMGQAYPELVRAEGLIAETLKLEETRFRATLARGLAILEDETRDLGRGRQAARRSRVQALRHIRLSARSDAGRLARARPRRRHRRLRLGDGAPARRSAQGLVRFGRGGDRDDLVRLAREARARPNSSAMRPRRPKASRSRFSRTARKSRASSAGEKGALILNQTPFYGESGGQVGDTGTIVGAGFRAKVTDTRKKLGDLFVHDIVVEEGALKLGMALELAVDHARRLGDPRQPFGDPSAARGLAHGARRSCRAERLAGRARPSAFRHRPSEADHARRNLSEVEDIANRDHPAERAGDDAPDGGRRSAWPRAPALCSARNTAMKCASSRWGRSRAATMARAPIRSSFAAARMSRAPATSASSRSPAKARSRPACAASRRGPAMTPRKGLNEEARALADIACALARAGRGGGRAARRLDRGTSQARARIERRAPQTRDGRRRFGGRGEAVRDVGGVKLYARAVSGVEMKDLKSMADEAKQSLGSGVVAIVAPQRRRQGQRRRRGDDRSRREP